jgi:hypothetical protein
MYEFATSIRLRTMKMKPTSGKAELTASYARNSGGTLSPRVFTFLYFSRKAM